MATGNTCGATDASLPRDLLEELRKYLNADPANRAAYKARMGIERAHLDEDDCCLLEDLGGIYCGRNRCCHDSEGKKTGNNQYRPHKKLGDTLP